MKPQALKTLVYWIQERENIRLARAAGSTPPWTDDPILQTYRFCNVRRMDDKVSQWLLNNWYLPYKDHPNTLAAVVLARHFNLPSALEWLTDLVFHRGRVEWARIKEVVRERKALGFNVFNSAYMVRGIGTTDKTEMVVDRVARPLHESSKEGRIIYPDSMKKTHEVLSCFWGMGSFMAGQVVADLRWAVTGRWSDRHTWAPVGPGSARGMNRLHDRDVKAPLHQDQFLEDLTTLVGKLRKALPGSIADRLEVMDYQNCLCEFDKYERTLRGEGKPKQLYRGGGLP
jgi:hypothetical protein